MENLTPMEKQIARYMLRVAKFEFYIINRDIALARVDGESRKVNGINWTKLAELIEVQFPFSEFDFNSSPFLIFRETAPQFLTKPINGDLKWDSDDVSINSWERLLSRGFAQLRNNIAHGNKAQMSAPFTHERTEKFLAAGDNLIDFIAADVLGNKEWEGPINFK